MVDGSATREPVARPGARYLRVQLNADQPGRALQATRRLLRPAQAFRRGRAGICVDTLSCLNAGKAGLDIPPRRLNDRRQLIVRKLDGDSPALSTRLWTAASWPTRLIAARCCSRLLTGLVFSCGAGDVAAVMNEGYARSYRRSIGFLQTPTVRRASALPSWLWYTLAVRRSPAITAIAGTNRAVARTQGRNKSPRHTAWRGSGFLPGRSMMCPARRAWRCRIRRGLAAGLRPYPPARHRPDRIGSEIVTNAVTSLPDHPARAPASERRPDRAPLMRGQCVRVALKNKGSVSPITQLAPAPGAKRTASATARPSL